MNDVFRPGELCGTYRIVRLLGQGGFADVYQAIDVTNQQKVALKCLKLRHLSNARITRRMVAETELLARLDHPNVVQVEDAGINGGVLWLAMEYLSGKTLRQRLRAARGPLPPEVALYYARQIGEGIAAAHELNVVHRDLKPENIMITTKDEVKVLDLGAAKFFDRELTLSGQEGAIGTPLYMSPEQIRAEAVDFRADVYALGLILYEMLAGRHAFAQPNGELPPAFELGTLQLHAQPTPLTGVGKGVPVAVWKVVEKALAKKPADRFGSMAELVLAIRATLRSVLESPGADQLWDEVMAHPGPAPAARGDEGERSIDRSVFESQEAALKPAPEPNEEPAAPKVEPDPKPPSKSQAELRSASEAKDPPRKKNSAPFVPNGGEEIDPDDEPLSGVRNIAALSPAPEAPKPAPALARVVRIGPGGRQGEIVQAPEPAAAPPIKEAQPAAVIASVASVVSVASVALNAAPSSEEPLPLVIAEQAPPAALETAHVSGELGKLEDIAAPPPAVASLWSRLRAAVRLRSRVAIALVPMLGVLLALALRPPAFMPFAQSALPGIGLGPILVSAASQPASDLPFRAEPILVAAPMSTASPPAADIAIPAPEDAPAKARASGAQRVRGSIQEAPGARVRPVSFASAEECGKLLVLTSTPRCPAGSMASAAAPAGHGKL